MFIALIVLAVVVVLFLACWTRVKADKAVVITGLKKRVLTGTGGIVIPLVETTCKISLEAISMTTDVSQAPSKQGIFVDIIGTAVVKVENEKEAIIKAVERFCTGGIDETVANINKIVEKILEGKLRGIVSTLTVEQINEDRASFEQSIEDAVTSELKGMGLELISYSILKISTQGGYLENRAKPQIAKAQSDADIAESERERDTEIKTSEARKNGEKAKLEAETQIAEAKRDKKLKTEAYRAEESKAEVEANVAKQVAEVEKQQLVEDQKIRLAEKQAEVKEKQLIIDVLKPAQTDKEKVKIDSESKKQKEIIDAEAEKEKRIIDAKASAEAIRLEADAKAYALEIEAQSKAKAKRLEAEADADAIKVTGNAEANVIREKAIAEAEGTEKLAEAMEKFGEAAVIKMALDKLPEIVHNVAKPMEQIDTLTIIDNGDGKGGASNLTGTVATVASQGFQVLKDITGIDIAEKIKGEKEECSDVSNKLAKGLEGIAKALKPEIEVNETEITINTNDCSVSDSEKPKKTTRKTTKKDTN